MEKVKLEFKLPKSKKIEYGDITIEVVPFITTSQQVFLINQYVNDLFKEEGGEGTGYNYLDAEYNLVNYLYQMVTNIDTDEMSPDIYSDHGLFDLVTSSIYNYNDFIMKLEKVVEGKKESIALENSLGNVLSKFVDKAYAILDKVSNISPEEIKKLQDTGMEIANKLEKSSILTGEPVKKARRKKLDNVGEV